jgi:hypothetical protein
MIRRSRLDRFLVGALLAAGLFLIEAGVADVLIAREMACRTEIDLLRWGQDLGELCTPAWVLPILSALSRGALDFQGSGGSISTLWFATGGFYALLGGLCGQIAAKWGAAIFLLIQLSSLAVITALGFLLPHLA